METLSLAANCNGIEHEITFSFTDIIKKKDILKAKMIFIDLLKSRLNVDIKKLEVVVNFDKSKGLILNALSGKNLDYASPMFFVN
jgi:dTDP-4-amino-4,6-dideoxygalactose transaminase